MKELFVLNKTNYLNYTRSELCLMGFNNKEINDIVYGEIEKVIKLIDPLKLKVPSGTRLGGEK